MKLETTPSEGFVGRREPWEPMRLHPVGTVSELMRSGALGSRLDNNSGGVCGLSNRRTGGTGAFC